MVFQISFLNFFPFLCSEKEIECTPPVGYGIPSNWEDELWLKGDWKDVDGRKVTDEITECFDPLRCYGKPPSLPGDYTVVWNVTDDDPPPDAPVNYTIEYKCDRKCESECRLFWTKSRSIFRLTFEKA